MRKKHINPIVLAIFTIMAVLYPACNQDLPCLENSRAFVTAGLYHFDTNSNTLKDTGISMIYIANFMDYSALLAANNFLDGYTYDSLSISKGNKLRLGLDPLSDSTYYLMQIDTIYDYELDTIMYDTVYTNNTDSIIDTVMIDSVFRPLKRRSIDKLIFISTREAYLVSYNCGFSYKHNYLIIDSNYFDYIKDIVVTKKEINPSDENEQVKIIF